MFRRRLGPDAPQRLWWHLYYWGLIGLDTVEHCVALSYDLGSV